MRESFLHAEVLTLSSTTTLHNDYRLANRLAPVCCSPPGSRPTASQARSCGSSTTNNSVSFISDTRLPHRSERTRNGLEISRDIAKGKVNTSSAEACNRWRRPVNGMGRESVWMDRIQKGRKREGEQARDDGAYLQLSLLLFDPAVPLLRLPPRRGPFTQATNHLHGCVCRSSKSLAGQFPFLCRVIPSRRV